MTEKALKHIIHGTPKSENQLSNAVYSTREIKKRLKEVFYNYCVKSAYLFGDYAKRDATPASEVDILFESELSEMERRDSLDLVQEIAETLGKNVNLLDARRIDQESKKEIQKNGVQIYSVNKQKLIRIILLSLYAPFSLFCICFAIHAILGPDSIRYYAWVGACTL